MDQYKIIYPANVQDIKDEAVQPQNCLASYFHYVLDGECHILFLRLKDNIKTSLVTLELQNYKVVQAKGKLNRDLTNEEQFVIDNYNERLSKLKNGGVKNVS